MLGIMDNNTDAIDRTCVDALKETLNILCGNILTEMAGDEPQFNLGPPQELEKQDALRDGDTAAEIWMDVEGQLILFRLQVDAPAEGAA